MIEYVPHDVLVLDYRTGGSRELKVGEPFPSEQSNTILSRTRALLIGRSEYEALSLLDRYDFSLWHATNGFGDEFVAVLATCAPESLADARAAAATGSPLRLASAALRRAAGDAHGGNVEVRFVALGIEDDRLRGIHDEYRIEDPMARGAFGTLHRAHTRAGDLVAVKRLYQRDEESIGRFRREIQEQSRIDHPNVMPVLDHDPNHRWFVMPLATENLAARWNRGPIDDSALLTILRSVAAGLGAAHALGLVHRDVSPRNILRIDDRWVVADWGLVRRPPGLTTLVRTQGELGTTGFAAPELFRHAHAAGPAADVYALGRIAAWVKTRAWPEQNVDLYPNGPWRQFVRATTDPNPTRRANGMAAVERHLREVELALEVAASQLAQDDLAYLDLEKIAVDRKAAGDCVERCLESPDDANLFIVLLPHVRKDVLSAWVQTRSADVERLVRSMDLHLEDRAVWTSRSFEASNGPIAWLRTVAQFADVHRKEGLFEDASLALLQAEERWQRFAQRHDTRAWLMTLKGENARIFARLLATKPSAMKWLASENWSPIGADVAIVAAFAALGPRA